MSRRTIVITGATRGLGRALVERFTEAFHYDELGVPAALTAGRVGHTVTPLRDGRVLVAGGARLRMVSGGDQTPVPGIDTFLGTLEVYDPRTGEVEVLEQQLVPGRAFHTATRLRGRYAQGLEGSTYLSSRG